MIARRQPLGVPGKELRAALETSYLRTTNLSFMNLLSIDCGQRAFVGKSGPFVWTFRRSPVPILPVTPW